MADVVVVLNSILTALQQSGGNVNTLATTLQTHLNAVSSHSKSQVGLGLLDNFRTATQQDIENGVPNAYVTPEMLIYGVYRFNTSGVQMLDATEIIKGILRIATNTEAKDLVTPLNNVAITPANLKEALDNYVITRGITTTN